MIGLDLAEAPLGEARELAAREGVPIEFAVGDCYALLLANASPAVTGSRAKAALVTTAARTLRDGERCKRATKKTSRRRTDRPILSTRHGWNDTGTGGIPDPVTHPS